MLLCVQLFDFKDYIFFKEVHKYQPKKREINFQLFFSDKFKAQRLSWNYLTMPLNSVQFTAKCDNKRAFELNLHLVNQQARKGAWPLSAM